MDELQLVPLDPRHAEAVADYRAAFAPDRPRVTWNPESVPGLDGLERYESAADWIRACGEMTGKVSWFLTVRRSDGRVIGALCLRYRLEYDEDDEEFASHIGYSVRPDERGRGYGVEQLRLGLGAARALGLERVRLVCRDANLASRRVILKNGGVFLDALYGEESGMTVLRYDIPL